MAVVNWVDSEKNVYSFQLKKNVFTCTIILYQKVDGGSCNLRPWHWFYFCLGRSETKTAILDFESLQSNNTSSEPLEDHFYQIYWIHMQ
jgi:hypothetical protein